MYTSHIHPIPPQNAELRFFPIVKMRSSSMSPGVHHSLCLAVRPALAPRPAWSSQSRSSSPAAGCGGAAQRAADRWLATGVAWW